MKEHDCVVLTEDLAAERLQAGDVGTVVHVHKDGAAFEVEFVTLTGRTVAVVTVETKQVRPVASRDLSHARPLTEPQAASVREKPAKYGR